VCVQSGAQGNPTEESYSDQGQSIALGHNKRGIATESWRMSGELYYVLQGTISRLSFRDEVTSNNLSESRLLHYFNTRRGDFGILFDGSNQELSVPWHDVIYVLWEVF
jgi:hypothetical protein